MKLSPTTKIRTTVASRENPYELASCFVDLETLSQPIDFNNLFGRPGKLEVEIGVGKGRFLRERAQAFPETNFLGIEKALKYLHQSGQRIEKEGVENVRLVCCYVEELVRDYFPDETVDAFHILFSDPWPKKRHHKRRLFQALFLKELIRTLKRGGEIRVATDHGPYFEVIRDLFEDFTEELKLDLSPGTEPFMTNFQAKYIQEGRKIYFLTATKS